MSSSSSYVNLPLFSVNVKIWHYLGFIEHSSNYRRILVILLVPLLINVGQLMYIYVMRQLMNELVLGLFMAAIIFNSLLRICFVVANEVKFRNFMKDIAAWYEIIEDHNDKNQLERMKQICKRTNAVSIFSMTFGSFGGILTILFPLILPGRKLPYDIYIPGIDVLQSPYYELIYIMEIVFIMPFIMTTYVPFTNLFITWLIFGIGILQDLCLKLEKLQGQFLDENQMLDQMKKLIRYHQRIIRFCKKLEELVSFLSLVEFMLLSIMLCVLLFFLLMTDVMMLKFITIIYIGCIFYVIFLSYWHANEFSYESLKIAQAAYNVDWINGSREFKKCVLILIKQSQNALQITAGGIYPMTLETFQALLNVSYSIFTLLQGLTAK